MENRIADQARGGNAYWITSQRTRPNEWVIFGPERSFILVANVYDCPYPNKARTAKNDAAAVAQTPIVIEEQVTCESSMYGGQTGC